MPIDLTVNANPDELRSVGGWLRQLSGKVHDCGSQVHRGRSELEAAWGGEAGAKVQSSMGKMGGKTDGLSVDANGTGQGFLDYGDDMATVKSRMQQAREVAAAAGLETTASSIADPGPTPTKPPPGADRSTGMPGVDIANQQAAQDYAAWERKNRAYQEANATANEARKIQRRSESVFQRMVGSLVEKFPWTGADFLTGLAGAKIAQTSAWQRAAKGYGTTAASAAKNLTTPSAKAAAKVLEKSPAFANLLKSTGTTVLEKLPSGGGILSKATPVLSKIGLPGLGLTAASSGFDIANGKNPTKTIVSSAAGTAASVGVGFAMASNPVGWTVAAGTAASVGTSMLVEEYGDEAVDAVQWGAGKVADGAEWVADRAVDGAEWVGDRAEDVAGAAADGAEWVADKASDLGGTVSDVADDVLPG